MQVLVGCERSQKVCKAFRVKGHEAYSCDTEPEYGGKPEWHLHMDVCDAVRLNSFVWDLIILHPDCTYLALCGNKHYGRNKDGTPKPKHHLREKAIHWTLTLWDLATFNSPRVVLENPASVIFPYLKKHYSVQYIQPWQFGHGEQKKTGLALHGVPPLKPTNIVKGREQRIWKMAPGPNRKRDRSETYRGIADAFADQWGQL